VLAVRVSDLHRTAFITGASTGLGRSFAEMLLSEGVRVWGTSRSVDRLAPLSIHPYFTPVPLDLRDGAAAEAVFQTAEQVAGGFDLVINNAGYGVFDEFASADFSLWEKQIQVMLVSPTRLSHAALRGLLARSMEGRKGALVNISSLAAEFPLPFQSAYNLAKSGLSALSESLMIEVEDTGVIVLDFRPGDYRTDFESSVYRRSGDLSRRMTRAWSAFKRMMISGPPPSHAAEMLRRALLQHRSGTVRTGRFFQAKAAPFLARFGSLSLRRRIQARYFDVT
jgi:short-subunit dehydrogenase